MNFKLTLNNTKEFKNIFNSIGNILDETIITINNEGLHLKGLDKSHISFVSLTLNQDYFDEIKVEGEVKINVDIYQLVKVLKMLSKDDTLTLKQEEDSSVLLLIFNGESERTFKLRLLDEDYDTPKPPVIDYPVSLELPYKLFKKWVSDAVKLGDKGRLGVDEDFFFLSSVNDFSDMNVKYVHGEMVGSSVGSMFSVEKLLDCLSADGFSSTVKLGLGDNMPVSLSLKNVYDSELSFMIAPRIEQEE